MSTRKEAEIAFGSDAFLDVIANIVGILIILIVVAGMKVGRAPVTTSSTSVETPSAPPDFVEDVPLPEPEVIAPAPVPLSPDEPIGLFPTVVDAAPILPDPLPLPSPGPVKTGPVEPAPVEELPELPPVGPPRELVEQAGQVESEIARLRDLRLAQSDELTRQELKGQELSRSVDEATSHALEAAASLRSRREQLASIEQSLAARQREATLVERQLMDEQTRSSPVETIRHRLSPIGRVVQGEEIHFRLAGNRVSYVPVNELAKLVQRDMERHKDILLTRSLFKGTIGPLDGYQMEYVMQRQSLSMTDQLRYGPGTVRILVTSWVIRPQAELVSESADEALQANSRFVDAIRRAAQSTTITLWVYPDSFDIHRQLKQAIQDTGFQVASRPLPEGVPIAGTPEGSRSVAQ